MKEMYAIEVNVEVESSEVKNLKVLVFTTDKFTDCGDLAKDLYTVCKLHGIDNAQLLV